LTILPVDEASAPIDSTIKTSATTAQLSAQPATSPFNAAYCRFTKRTKGDAISFAWVAEKGDEPILFVGYDSTRVPRSIIDVIVARNYGTPAEIAEVTL
jgi:hypothetical protein